MLHEALDHDFRRLRAILFPLLPCHRHSNWWFEQGSDSFGPCRIPAGWRTHLGWTHQHILLVDRVGKSEQRNFRLLLQQSTEQREIACLTYHTPARGGHYFSPGGKYSYTNKPHSYWRYKYIVYTQFRPVLCLVHRLAPTKLYKIYSDEKIKWK